MVQLIASVWICRSFLICWLYVFYPISISIYFPYISYLEVKLDSLISFSFNKNSEFESILRSMKRKWITNSPTGLLEETKKEKKGKFFFHALLSLSNTYCGWQRWPSTPLTICVSTVCCYIVGQEKLACSYFNVIVMLICGQSNAILHIDRTIAKFMDDVIIIFN